jgi:hypothetical protein
MSFSLLFMKIMTTIFNSFINLTQIEKNTNLKKNRPIKMIKTDSKLTMPIAAGKRANHKRKSKRKIVKKRKTKRVRK